MSNTGAPTEQRADVAERYARYLALPRKLCRPTLAPRNETSGPAMAARFSDSLNPLTLNSQEVTHDKG